MTEAAQPLTNEEGRVDDIAEAAGPLKEWIRYPNEPHSMTEHLTYQGAISA